MAVLSLLFSINRVNAILLTIVATVIASVGTLLSPAYIGILREIVPKDQIHTAYTVNQGRGYAVSIIMPSIAGILYVYGANIVLCVGVVLGVIAAISISHLPSKFEHHADRKLFFADMLEGLKAVFTSRRLSAAVFGGAIFNIGVNGSILAATLYLKSIGTAANRIALMETYSAIGAVIGVFLAEKIIRAVSVRTIIILCGIGFSAAIAVSSAFNSASIIGLILALPALLLTAWNSGVFGFIISDTDSKIQGRVQSVIQVVTGLSGPLAAALVGIILEWAGYVGSMFFFSVCALAGTIVQLFGKWSHIKV
jgi:hypothetical protein